jgi:hypothetical protein
VLLGRRQRFYVLNVKSAFCEAGMEHDSEPCTNDPADWNRASYNHHPCDDLEPLPDNPSDYREISLRFFRVALCWDTFVSSSRDARLASIQVSIALGLTSTRGRTVTDIAEELGITKQALSRGVAKFLRMSGLPGAFGLKSAEARRTYQKCH